MRRVLGIAARAPGLATGVRGRVGADAARGEHAGRPRRRRVTLARRRHRPRRPCTLAIAAGLARLLEPAVARLQHPDQGDARRRRRRHRRQAGVPGGPQGEVRERRAAHVGLRRRDWTSRCRSRPRPGRRRRPRAARPRRVPGVQRPDVPRARRRCRSRSRSPSTGGVAAGSTAPRRAPDTADTAPDTPTAARTRRADAAAAAS